MTFNPYEYRNDTVALAAAIDRIAELEQEIEWRKGYEVDLLQRHNDLRKVGQDLVDGATRDYIAKGGLSPGFSLVYLEHFDALASQMETNK